MTRAELISILEQNGIGKSSDRTILNTYSDNLSKKSLLSAFGGNRLQSGWKKAEYVIAKFDNTNEKLEHYLGGWSVVVADYKDQYLCLELSENEWKFFNYRGDEVALKDILPKQQISENSNLQIIYFGSPGTGKSHAVNTIILDNVKEQYVFRTTFHTDTDYSTFVGCYKPINKRKVNRVISYDELEIEYEKYEPQYKTRTEAQANFIKDYAESILEAGKASSLNQIIKNLFKTGNDTYFVEMARILLEERDRYSSIITYSFVPQVFTEAYIKAWQNPTEQVYLVIEEINRGNCAQIFGDLFQLLDRKKGVSEYPVKAESALAEYLSNVLEGDAAEGIRDGKLCLPANLNIIATMNTSDQSLFPMDSAFKRRWDWKFIPTTPPKDKDKTLELKLQVGDFVYSWKEFLNAANEKIRTATKSDDKQLGFWFVKSGEENRIKVSDFVSKVIFYLWNDVFKDLPAGENNPFTINTKEGKKTTMSFNCFFDLNENNEVVEVLDVVHTFMKNFNLTPDQDKEVKDTQDKLHQEFGDPYNA